MPTKMSKKRAEYVPSYFGSHKCKTCMFFIHSGHCHLVAGPINPNGHCRLYKARFETLKRLPLSFRYSIYSALFKK